ncbi:MAG: ACP S-malonyltransferase [Alphaproteobacteria bacterium]
MKIAFLFPGQGSQMVGMGQDIYQAFPIARDIFSQVDDAIGEKLSDIIFLGPIEKLTITEYTQPALMATSIAILKVIEQESGFNITQIAQAVAGHSLGEYSALTAVSSLPLATCANLLKTRGRAMQSAVPMGKGAMVALLGMDADDVNSIVDEVTASGADVACANDNADGQVVISGDKISVEKTIALAKTKNFAKPLKRAVALPVSAPFHSPLMKPAMEKMAQALQNIKLQNPLLPIYNNVTALPQTDGEKIKHDLVAQVCARVRFRETIQNMTKDGFDHFVEIGPGKVLSGLVKRITADATTINIGNLADIKEQLAFFKNSV